MSIIIGLISKKCELVASDGRLTSGAEFKFGSVIKKAIPIDDQFDKTFSLKEGRIIGTVAGLMEFHGLKISEHLENILNEECNNVNFLDQTMNCLATKLKTRIEGISDAEILFEHRIIDLILIGSTYDEPNDLKLFSFRFKPDLNSNIITVESSEIPAHRKGFAHWQLFGDDASQESVNRFLSSELKETPIEEKRLRSLSYKAIRLGIISSSKHEFGEYPTCGGKPFVKTIK
jgi:hypothetical protein